MTMAAGGIFRPGMRAYFVPLVAGVLLAASAFLPWVIVGNVSIAGVPDVEALWVAGLGALAAALALLSLITRKNSRHPLLIVGLASLGVLFLSWRILPRSAGERALTVSQAFAIVENTPMVMTTTADVGVGIYVGLAASSVLVLFGLTIVVKRAAQPCAVADARRRRLDARDRAAVPRPATNRSCGNCGSQCASRMRREVVPVRPTSRGHGRRTGTRRLAALALSRRELYHLRSSRDGRQRRLSPRRAMRRIPQSSS